MMEEIGHTAEIIGIRKNELIVRIRRQSACGSCCAKTVCGMGDAQEKIFAIPDENAEKFKIGEKVRLAISAQNGFLAVWYGYILPLILMISVLFGVNLFTDNEIISGISAIIILIPYYFILFLGRKLFNKKFTFTIIRD